MKSLQNAESALQWALELAVAAKDPKHNSSLRITASGAGWILVDQDYYGGQYVITIRDADQVMGP